LSDPNLDDLGSASGGSRSPDGARPRVLAVVFDPTFRTRAGAGLVDVCGYNDPHALTRAYVRDIAEASGGFLQYQVVETLTLPEFPRKADGFCYDAESFLHCWRAGKGWHDPDAVDYLRILEQTDAQQRVTAGEIDELWLWGPPYAGFWESTMVGREAYFCNSPPLDIPSCRRRFIVMGFNYERGVGEMLESFGHRVESMLAHAFGSWRVWGGSSAHAWDRFTAHDLVAPGQAGCGNVHFAPNSRHDYDWGNPEPVWSTCDRWPGFPRDAEKKRLVDCREWGGGDIRAHHKWWLAHLPRSAGETHGVRNNWWGHVVYP
jgi:hypothetical protein